MILLAGLGDQTAIDVFNIYMYFRPFLVVFEWMKNTHFHIGSFSFTFAGIFIFTFLASAIMWILGFSLGIWKK